MRDERESLFLFGIRGVLVQRSPGFLGIRIGRYYLSARSARFRPLFSERNRIRTHVCPLLGGWRLVLKVDA